MFDLMPFGRNERNLFDYFDNIEKAFFGNSLNQTAQFRADILDEGDKFRLQAELPGFAKEEIQVDVERDQLVISACHNEEKEEKDGNYVRRERRCGSFSRRFDASGIDTAGIKASYESGILSLELPKKKPELPSSTQIQIQ